MATVAFVDNYNHGGSWSAVSTGDTATPHKVTKSGFYAFATDGTYAGGSTAKLLYGPTSSPTKSVSTDATGTEWSATSIIGVVIVWLAEGFYVQPSVTGGAADDINFYLAYAGDSA